MTSFFSRAKTAAATFRQHVKMQKRRKRRPQTNAILNTRQRQYQEIIQRDGFVVVPGFYDSSACDALRLEIDRSIFQYGDQVVVDAHQSDHRAHGANRVSPLIDVFFRNPLLTAQMKSYQKIDEYSGFTLAAKLEYKSDNKGSGGGWHRDWPVDRQFKAIMYVSDVDQSNGPFQYWRGSHRTAHMLKTILRHGFEFNQARFDDGTYEDLFNRQCEMVTLPGKKGTLILADTRGIHRGMPIQSGCRYTLTNYYWPGVNSIPSHIKGLLLHEPQRSAVA